MNTLKTIFILIFLLLVVGCAGGKPSIPTELNYSENGELIMGRKCQPVNEANEVCCTTKAPYKGKIREFSACYPQGEVPEKEAVPVK